MVENEQLSKIFIALDVPKNTYSKLDYVRKKLASKINVDSSIPLHITLRSSFYTEKNKVDFMITELKNYISNFPDFDVTTKKFEFFEENYLVAKVYKSSAIYNLHEDVINITKSFQDKINHQGYENLDAKQEDYQNEYGSPYVFEYYQPHITLLYSIKENVELLDFAMKHEQQKFKFKAESISIVEKKPEGKYDVLERILLKN